MNYDPGALQQLQSMGLSREDAIDCLKACNNNLSHAADYYWNGDLEKSRSSKKWDEGAWNVSREGASSSEGHSYQNNWTSDYQVQGDDVLSPNAFEGTKSRPSSPNVTFDPELARALAASMQGVTSAEGFVPQETGTTKTHTSPVNANFAPAKENKEYDPSQWALTTTETQEVTQEPPPRDRKRELGVPAFLRPSISCYSLSSALTILHYIPQAKEAFISRRHLLQDYGHNQKWWSGERIQSSRVIDVENEGAGRGEAEEELAEVQRLMAFLGGTDRAYGSIDVLADMPRVREQEQSAVLSTFFKGWLRCIKDIYHTQGYEDISVFESVAHMMQADGNEKKQDFQVLEAIVTPSDSTLYCSFDNMMWPDDESPVFVEFADVFCVQLRTEAPAIGVGIDIPAVLYPDRYTKPWLDSVRKIKEEIAAQKSKIKNLEVREEKLKRYRARDTEYDPKLLLEITISHFATSPTSIDPDDMTMDSQPELPDPSPLLKRLLQKLENNLSSLERQKQEAHEILLKLKRSFTSPGDSLPDLPPLTSFSLRGVCPEPLTTYVLLRGNPSQQADEEVERNTNEQWWCFKWCPSSDNGWGDSQYASYEAITATEDEVLLAAKSQGDNVLLVYANENAFQSVDEPLPGPLKVFVDRDNAAFSAELNPFPSPSNASPERKRRQDCLEDEAFQDDYQSSERGTPKRSSNSTRSSATLAAATPQDNIQDGRILLAEGTTVPNAYGTDNDSEDIELPPIEMMEKGHLSPVAKVFHLEPIPAADEEMPDIDHAEHIAEIIEEKGD